MRTMRASVISPITAFVDRTTMYKMVLYALGGLVVSSLVLGALGLIYATVLSQLGSLALLISLAVFLSYGLALVRNVHANHESSLITALIIFFLVSPAESWADALALTIAITGAIVSKYLLVYRKQHLVNAAALGVFVLALSGYGAASWWIATPWMLVPLSTAGVLVVSKVRKWVPVIAFLVTGCLVFIFEELRAGSDIVSTWSLFFVSYPALFLGFFMLTEPFTMPGTKRLQIGYGALVGFLSHTSLFLPVMTMSSELALIVGNLVMYPSSLRQKLQLRLIGKTEIATNTYEFEFSKPPGLRFTAGQYLEWMVSHEAIDARGIRRYFTIASAPTESTMKLSLKVPTPGSSFKAALATLPLGGIVIASQLAGDFILSKKVNQKIGMVAGGIGVTPFRSQVQAMIDGESPQDTVLFYCNNLPADLAYAPLWERAKSSFSFRLIPVFARAEPDPQYEIGYFDAAILKRHAPDYLERMWYVSGSPGMVAATAVVLGSVGVPSRQIVRDFFPGLA